MVGWVSWVFRAPSGVQVVSRAHVWSPAGTAQDLNALVPVGTGICLQEATAIADSGAIAAAGLLVPGNVGTARRVCNANNTDGFLLTPAGR